MAEADGFAALRAHPNVTALRTTLLSRYQQLVRLHSAKFERRSVLLV